MSKADKLRAAVHTALSECPVDEVLSVLVGSFVGLTVELVRRQGHDTNTAITFDGGNKRTVTISAQQEASNAG